MALEKFNFNRMPDSADQYKLENVHELDSLRKSSADTIYRKYIFSLVIQAYAVFLGPFSSAMRLIFSRNGTRETELY